MLVLFHYYFYYSNWIFQFSIFLFFLKHSPGINLLKEIKNQPSDIMSIACMYVCIVNNIINGIMFERLRTVL